MIGFLLRKTLYDLWDNMFKIVVLNLGFIACTAIPIFIPSLAGEFFKSAAVEILLIAFGIIACSIYLSAASYALKSISDYGTLSFADFFSGLKTTWPAGLVIGGLIFLLFLILTVVIPFYITMDPPLLGLMLSAVIFWSTMFALLSFQYYFIVYNRLGSNIIKSFRKCMLISLDNTGLSIFLLINNLIVLILSAVFAFMFPGPVGALLYLDEAVRIRLLKYDWLEANPEADRRKIPWDALLIEEREKTGTRSLKNFIFPWKD